MLMGGHLDLNSSLRYPDESLKESLKQTMINQEIIFKKQVHELHRLYAIQKSLMKVDGCSLDSFANHLRCESLPMEKIFPETHMVDFTLFTVANNFSQRPLGFQLPIGNGRESGHMSGALKSCSCDGNIFGEEVVNLSLSIGSSTNKSIKIGTDARKHRITYPSPKDIIDLEESTETTSSENANPVFPPDQSSRVSTDDLKNELSQRTTEFSKNGGCVHQEWSCVNQGSNEWHGGKRLISHDLDLNKDLHESCFDSNEHLENHPSTGSTSGVSCSPNSKLIGGSSSFTPVSSKQQKSQIKAKAIVRKVCIIDLESMPEPSSDLSEEEMAIPETREDMEKEKLILLHSGGGQDSFEGEKSTEADYLVQKAAYSLICISLQGSSASNQESTTKSGSSEIENEEEKQKRRSRCSSVDSYEALVLKLEESSIDEDSVSSKAFEINEEDKEKESGVKLRRGRRRLKDFQKDVLPSLSSLSRHEIWEDINIMQGVIRSREYKRLQKAKTGNANTENWFTPVRSRRSKLNYVGRRYYS